MAVAANMRILARVFKEAWNEGNYRVVYGAYSEAYRHHDLLLDTGPGPAGVVDLAKRLRAALADFHLQVEGVVAQGDHVATRYAIHGLHVAPLLGLPQSNQLIELHGMSFHRFAGGLIVEGWLMWDLHGLLAQLGQAQPLVRTPGPRGAA